LAFGQVDVGADVSRVVAELPEQGTYRLTTGEQLGAVTPMVFDRGHWRALAPGETAPRHARTSTLQMVVTADAYVTRGAPTAISLAPAANRLAILPLSNPDAVTLGTGLDLQLLFNGQPFAYMPFVVYRPGQSEDDMSRVFVTNEQGSAHLSFDQPGLYLAVVRYRAPAPANSDARVLSYSTSITFEVH